MITIYGKINCGSCIEAKSLCEAKGIEYEYKQMDKDYTIMDFFSIAPRTHRAFPMIAKDGEYLGTLDDLKAIL